MVIHYKNFLPEHKFRPMQELLLSSGFPYYWQASVGTPEDISFASLFTHMLVEEVSLQSDPIQNYRVQKVFVEPIIDRLNEEHGSVKIIRAKVNLYPYQNEHMKSSFHIDQTEKHKVLLLSINTNNGCTEFENGRIFNAVENNAIIFNGDLRHRSVSQTDHAVKVNINVNYVYGL